METETDAVLLAEFENVCREHNRLANTTLTETRDQIKYNLLRQRQWKIEKHLGFDRSQKLKSFFNDKRTQACSEESDFEFPESPDTAINMEEIKKALKSLVVLKHLKKSQDRGQFGRNHQVE